MFVVARQFRVDAPPQPCGRGWVGVKGNCKRKPKDGGGDRLAQERAGLGRLGKGSSTRQAKIDKLRAKLENKSSKLQKAATAERMKKGKTEKYRDLERQIDRRAGVLENRSVIAKVRAGQEKRSAARAEKLQQEMDAMWAKKAKQTEAKKGKAPAAKKQSVKAEQIQKTKQDLEKKIADKKVTSKAKKEAATTSKKQVTPKATKPKAESKNNATKRVNSKRKQYQEMFS
jgi:hypothetical protein